MPEKRYPPIFQSVPADEFTDRQDIIAQLCRLAANTPRDMTFSTSIVGQRRLGKTAVLEQVYNRLFWEQDEVVPIYFSFESKPTTSTEFALAYFVNFLQQYVAFRLKDDELARLDNQRVDQAKLVALAESLSEDPIANYADAMKYRLESPNFSLHEKLESTIYLPRRVMEYNRGHQKPETPIFVMLDEFQDVLKINYSDGKPADTVGLYQWASEGRKCPHIVTGSAVRLINQEVLGSGALFGRFDYMQFPPLESLYGLELVDRLGHKYDLSIPEPIAGYLVNRCGGNPFYIRCIMTQAARQQQRELKDEDAVSNLIAYEVTQGLIGRDWSGQLQRYFEQLNSHYIAKTVLFQAAQFQDERIVPEDIAAQLKRPPEEVQRMLRQLAFADMIDSRLGYMFYNLKDPILRDFIRTQYELDVEKKPLEQVDRGLLQAYRALKGKYADAVGALVEARLEALLHRFDDRTVDGRLFHTAGEVKLPRFRFVSDALVKPAGQPAYQIDLKGSWHIGYDLWFWVVEIKHWRKRVTADVVHKFTAACAALEVEHQPDGMVKWLVNAGGESPQAGFTPEAIAAMQQHGIYWSSAAEVNDLLRAFGIERLLLK